MLLPARLQSDASSLCSLVLNKPHRDQIYNLLQMIIFFKINFTLSVGQIMLGDDQHVYSLT